MKKIIRLNENDLARIVRRVIKEDEMSASGPKKSGNYDMSDLIGKTVEFTLLGMEVTKNGDKYYLDKGDMSEYGQESLFWGFFKRKLQGKIVEAEAGKGYVVIIVEQVKNGHPLIGVPRDPVRFQYGCGSKGFARVGIDYFIKDFTEKNEDFLYTLTKDTKDGKYKKQKSWFYGAELTLTYECPKLEEHLQNRPPCGGFDFSMNKNGMDNNDSFA